MRNRALALLAVLMISAAPALAGSMEKPVAPPATATAPIRPQAGESSEPQTRTNLFSNIADGFSDLFSGKGNPFEGAKLFFPQAEVDQAQPAPPPDPPAVDNGNPGE